MALRRKRKLAFKVSLGAALTSLVVLLIVDIATMSCMLEESTQDTETRLICDPPIENTTLANSTLHCVEGGFKENGGGDACVKPSSCTAARLNDFVAWVALNPAVGVFAAASVYAVATVCFVPGSLLTLGCGAAFSRALGIGPGVALGSVTVWMGACTGSFIAFIAGRYLLREKATEMTRKYKTLGAIDTALRTQGLKLLLLLRLSPVVPFNVLNFLMGSTAVDWKHYVLGTTVGICPGTIGYVFIGSAAASVAGGDPENCDGGSAVKIVLLVVGVVATIVAVVVLARTAKRELDKTLALDNPALPGDGSDVAPSASSVEVELGSA